MDGQEVVRMVCRDYANKSGSNKQHSLESLTTAKGKYNILD